MTEWGQGRAGPAVKQKEPEFLLSETDTPLRKHTDGITRFHCRGSLSFWFVCIISFICLKRDSFCNTLAPK